MIIRVSLYAGGARLIVEKDMYIPDDLSIKAFQQAVRAISDVAQKTSKVKSSKKSNKNK